MVPTASVMTLPPSAKPVPTAIVTERVFSIPCAPAVEGHSPAVRAAATITERYRDNPDSVRRKTRKGSAPNQGPVVNVGGGNPGATSRHCPEIHYTSRARMNQWLTWRPHDGV